MASVARTTIGVEPRLRQRLCRDMPIGGLKMPILVALIKGDPLVNVGGAYFPAWLVCMVAGGLATWVLHVLAARSRWPEVLQPAALMVSALFIALTCWTWFLFFAAR